MSSQTMFKLLPDKITTGIKTATFMGHIGLPVETDLTHYVAQQHYKCEKDGEVWYVVVSAANVPWSGPETYIFPANEKGIISRHDEQKGSFNGALDHKRALVNAGFEVIGCPIDRQGLRDAIEAAELQVKQLTEDIARAKLLLEAP